MNKLSEFKIRGDAGPTAIAKLPRLILCELSDANGEVTVSQRKISDALKISRSVARRNIRRLRDSGHIDAYPRYHSDGGRAANKFIVKRGKGHGGKQRQAHDREHRI